MAVSCNLIGIGSFDIEFLASEKLDCERESVSVTQQLYIHLLSDCIGKIFLKCVEEEYEYVRVSTVAGANWEKCIVVLSCSRVHKYLSRRSCCPIIMVFLFIFHSIRL